MRIFRSLWRSPGFAAAAVLTLALGIGVNVACFGVIRAVLLKPLGYASPDRLVLLSGGATPVHYQEIQAGAQQFSSIGAYAMEEDLTFRGGGGPQVLKTNRVSASFLETLGLAPLAGSGLRANEETALISYEFWQREFHGDFQAVGRPIDVGGSVFSIAGVLPQNFAFPAPGLDVWLAKPEESPQFPPASRALSPFLTVFGRLKPGVTLEQASAEVALLQARYAQSHAAMLDAKPKAPPVATPLQQAVVGRVKPSLGLLFAAVSLVLLIACVNLATLLLARCARRKSEFALRAALGASRMQIVQHLLAETLALYLLGGAAGGLLAFLTLAAIRTMDVAELPRVSEIGFDGMVLAYTAGLSLLSGLLFGLAPALTASRADLIFAIRGNRQGIARTGLRSFLVGIQIALSFILLAGTALLTETMLRLHAEPLGFNPENIVTARVALKPADDPRQFFDDLRQRLSTLPGVAHVSASLSLPMTSYPGTPVQRADQAVLPLNQRPLTGIFIVSPDYFATLEIPLKRGRTFTERDREGAPRVAVIDENLARHFWPGYPGGESPIGQRLLVGGVRKEPAEIIGIVGNVHQDLEASGWNRGVYVPFAQSPTPSAMLALRVASDPMKYAEAIRRSVEALHASQAVSELQPMQSLVDAQLGSRRRLMALLAFFSAVTLVLVLLGIYGLTAYSVAQRTQEMGVRRALGAPSSRILGMVIWQALRVALFGIAAGLAGAFAGTRFMASYLFHTSATDQTALMGVSALFVAVTVAAALRPAFSAARVDPAVALRSE